jgi:hypothetical protein
MKDIASQKEKVGATRNEGLEGFGASKSASGWAIKV